MVDGAASDGGRRRNGLTAEREAGAPIRPVGRDRSDDWDRAVTPLRIASGGDAARGGQMSPESAEASAAKRAVANR